MIPTSIGAHAVRSGDVRLRWFWFAWKIHDQRGLYVTWRSYIWWDQLWMAIKRYRWEALLWLGVWDLSEGDFYANGWWRWDFWRNRHSVWKHGATWDDLQPEIESARVKAQSRRQVIYYWMDPPV